MPMPRSQTLTDPPATEDRLRAGGSSEAVLLAAIVLLGFALRAVRWDCLAIEHFDEGVYASNLYCGHLDPPFAYPMRHLYAPPLFPALLEWAQILSGPSAAMWVNVLIGSLMVVAVWWTTRCWFGRTAAIAAAMLAATSEYHIAFSRMALTDVPLSLFMLLGVVAGWKAIVTGRPLWIAAAGLLAGLAWCTKYNGWLTLAVTGSGTAAALLVPKLLLRAGGGQSSGNQREKKKIANCKLQIANCKLGVAVVRWGLTAAMAGTIFWVFVLRDLAPVGGYAAVAKNHAGYFVGLSGWWSAFLRQADAHDVLMGWPTCFGIAAAFVLAAPWRGGHFGLIRCANLILIALGSALFARLLSVSGLLAVAAVVGFVVALRRSPVDGDTSDSNRLAAWMLLAWFVGLLVATPLYFPYPRLSLPWLVACWPLAGAVVAAIIERLPSASLEESKIQNPKSKITLPVGFAAACLALAGLVWISGRGVMTSGWPAAWQQRALAAGIAKVMLIEIETAAARTTQSRASDVEAVVYVQGDPATFYQLATLSRTRPIVVLPVADATGLQPTSGTPTFLVTHAMAGVVPSAPASAELVQSYEYQPSDLILLDRMPASAIRSKESRAVDVLRLDALTSR
jgi:dolichyl-phosphate-mannose-protein mannosyltransferase